VEVNGCKLEEQVVQQIHNKTDEQIEVLKLKGYGFLTGV